MVVSLLTLPLTVNISEDYKVHYIQSLLLDVLADAVHGSFHVIHLRCHLLYVGSSLFCLLDVSARHEHENPETASQRQ